MAKKIYDSEHAAETAKQRASRFVRDVKGDDDRADEIEDESLDEWLEESGRRIENPLTQKRRNNMATSTQTKADLLEENEALREENEALNNRLNQIFDIAAEPEDDDDEVEEDSDDDDSDDEDSDDDEVEEEEPQPRRRR